jgi:hypothetical protein
MNAIALFWFRPAARKAVYSSAAIPIREHGKTKEEP